MPRTPARIVLTMLRANYGRSGMSTASGELDQPLFEAGHRVQGLTFLAKLGGRQNVLRSPHADTSQRSSRTVRIGKIAAECFAVVVNVVEVKGSQTVRQRPPGKTGITSTRRVECAN